MPATACKLVCLALLLAASVRAQPYAYIPQNLPFAPLPFAVRLVHTQLDSSLLYVYLPTRFLKYEGIASDAFTGNVILQAEKETPISRRFRADPFNTVVEDSLLVLGMPLIMPAMGKATVHISLQCIDADFEATVSISTFKSAASVPPPVEVQSQQYLTPVPPMPLCINRPYFIRTNRSGAQLALYRLADHAFLPDSGYYQPPRLAGMHSTALSADRLLAFTEPTALVAKSDTLVTSSYRLLDAYIAAPMYAVPDTVPTEALGMVLPLKAFQQNRLNRKRLLALCAPAKLEGAPLLETLRQRIRLANQYFNTLVPGWQTAEGHALLLLGLPDSVNVTEADMQWHYKRLALTLRFKLRSELGLTRLWMLEDRAALDVFRSKLIRL